MCLSSVTMSQFLWVIKASNMYHLLTLYTETYFCYLQMRHSLFWSSICHKAVWLCVWRDLSYEKPTTPVLTFDPCAARNQASPWQGDAQHLLRFYCSNLVFTLYSVHTSSAGIRLGAFFCPITCFHLPRTVATGVATYSHSQSKYKTVQRADTYWCVVEERTVVETQTRSYHLSLPCTFSRKA